VIMFDLGIFTVHMRACASNEVHDVSKTSAIKVVGTKGSNYCGATAAYLHSAHADLSTMTTVCVTLRIATQAFALLS
jgi:hypothetical protein